MEESKIIYILKAAILLNKREYSNKYYKNNKEILTKYHKEYYKNNKGEKRKRDRENKKSGRYLYIECIFFNIVKYTLLKYKIAI